MLAVLAFCEAVGKVPGGCKYTQQKKGRDKALQGLIRPLRALFRPWGLDKVLKSKKEGQEDQGP